MPRFRRLVVPDYPHHMTQRGVRRQKTFFDSSDYRRYVTLATTLVEQFDIDVWAYCLMPNHVHAVVVPRCRDALSRFFAALHRRYARETNSRYDWKGHLWQERFYSVVMDQSHTMAAMRYVELNPVRAGLVRHASDWPWSSARGNLGLSDDPLVDRAAVRQVVSNWADYLGEDPPADEWESLRRHTRTGRPGGDDSFMDTIESCTGRRVRRKARSRTKR